MFKNKKEKKSKDVSLSNDHPIPPIDGWAKKLENSFTTAEFEKKKIQIGETKATIYYLVGLSDESKIEEIIDELSNDPSHIHDYLENQAKKIHDFIQLERSIIEGDAVWVEEGGTCVYSLHSKNTFQRALVPPTIDNSLKGSKISFVETYETNIGLLRRLIQNRNFKTEEMKIGTDNQSTIAIVHLGGVADDEIVTKVKESLSKIKQDQIINTNELAQLIEEHPISPFPQILTTERPDDAAMYLLKGKVAVILDRSSQVMILPTEFNTYFQSIDDYTNRTLVASFNRLLRWMATFLTLFLPATYIAIVSFNYEIVPLKLIISIGESRATVPFGPLFEALIMELTLEMLREAAIRLPSPISTTVGIVGGIVIGQAAVQAGIVSHIMVIIVATTAISSFIIPNYEMASGLRILRFPIMFMAALFGLVGIAVSAMVILIHLLSLSSFGTSYTTPYSPIQSSFWKDAFIRFPLHKLWKKDGDKT